MKLIVGLGNPAPKYFKNRHNAGFLLVDFLQSLSLQNTLLEKSDVFMNSSGKSVQKFMQRHKVKLDNLYIAHDDLDLKLGDYKIQFATGPKLHNGVDSVEQKLGTKNFWRIRIGVDARDSQARIAGEEYVLQDFDNSQLQILQQTFKQIQDQL